MVILRRKAVNALIFSSVFALANTVVQGQIQNLQNGETIPGTESIQPGPGVNLSRWNSVSNHLQFADLSQLDLSLGTFASSWLENSSFENSKLADANFLASRLHDTNLSGSIITGTDFSGTTVGGFTKEQLYSTASYPSRNLRGIRLGANNLTAWNFSDQDLEGAQFYSSILEGADFLGANVSGANFSDVTSGGFSATQLESTASYRELDLSGIRLGNNDLTGWDFSSQILTRADFQDTTLKDTVFSAASVAGASFLRTTANGFTQEQLYSTFSYQNKKLQGVQLGMNDLSKWNLARQDLSGASLAASNLEGANLEGSILSNADLGGSNLLNASLTDSIIDGVNVSYPSNLTKEQLYSTGSYRNKSLPGVRFEFRDLSEWDFTEQDLTYADFYGAKLSRVSFARTTLDGANLENSQLDATNLAGASLVGANLRGAFGFSPAESTDTRNAVMPDGVIQGIDLRDNERLAIPFGAVTVEDQFTSVETATLQMNVEANGPDRWRRSQLMLLPETDIRLGGRLEVVWQNSLGFGMPAGTIDIFTWAQPPGLNERFSRVELPAGAWDTSMLYSTGQINLVTPYRNDGDFDVDGVLDATDIDRLTLAIQAGHDLSYDLNKDGSLDATDRLDWVYTRAATYLGDTNLDGEFNSADLVVPLQTGEYEDAIALNSTWIDGDWDGDLEFTSRDFVAAMADGGYEQGPRLVLAEVPEPSSVAIPTILALSIAALRRRQWR